MAFTGLSTNRLFTPNAIGEDISKIIATLAPVEAPFLDWLGDGGGVALSPKHEYFMDFLRPHYIIASTAVNSATAATPVQVNGLGESLVVGTILENETAATPEITQVNSILGPNTIVLTRNYDGAGIGSLAAGGQLYVRGPAGVEGQDHAGQHTARPGTRTSNTVGLFNIPVAVSGTQLAIARNTLGLESYDDAVAKTFRQIPSDLEKEILRGVLNTNTLGTATTTRTMKGLRAHLSGVNSTIAASSFAADPHKYIGDVWQSVFNNGASADEDWAIVAGYTWYRSISNLNDSKVQDSNASEQFKRVITTYQGPFGRCSVFPSRVLPASELLLVPRNRVRVVPMTGRSFAYQELGLSGDNKKGQVVGEYTIEVHHPDAMGRAHI